MAVFLTKRLASGISITLGGASALGAMYLVWLEYSGSFAESGIALYALASVLLVGIASVLLGAEGSALFSEAPSLPTLVVSQFVVGLLVIACCLLISISAMGVNIDRIYVEATTYITVLVVSMILYHGSAIAIEKMFNDTHNK